MGMRVVFLENDPFLQLDPSLDHKDIKRTMEYFFLTSLQFQILYTLNSPVHLFSCPDIWEQALPRIVHNQFLSCHLFPSLSQVSQD